MPILRPHALRFHERRISSVTFTSAHLYGNAYVRVGVARALSYSSDFELLGEQSSHKFTPLVTVPSLELWEQNGFSACTTQRTRVVVSPALNWSPRRHTVGSIDAVRRYRSPVVGRRRRVLPRELMPSCRQSLAGPRVQVLEGLDFQMQPRHRRQSAETQRPNYTLEQKLTYQPNNTDWIWRSQVVTCAVKNGNVYLENGARYWCCYCGPLIASAIWSYDHKVE